MQERNDPNRRDLLKGAAALAGAAATVSAAGAAKAADGAIDLSGRSVLITGSSSGFGRLTALHCARAGATVIASMRNLKGGKRPEAQELLDIASAEKLALTVVDIDVTRDDQVVAGARQAEKTAGGALDALFNNAGIAIAGPVEMHDHEQAMKQFDTNLFGYHRMARAVLPAMRRKRQGLLIQTSSQLGRIILPNIGMYCASKYAVEAMFEAMAYELAPFGVEATIVQPGGYPTKIWDNGARYFAELMESADAERKENYAGHVEMAEGMFNGGGSTDPMDIARAVAEIIALPPGQRPLRRAVHPNTQATDALNAAHAQVQAAVLGQGRYKAWHDAVAS